MRYGAARQGRAGAGRTTQREGAESPNGARQPSGERKEIPKMTPMSLGLIFSDVQ
jgi:hypothetical protein